MTRHKLHQWLTEDIGHPKLREHLASTSRTRTRATGQNWI